MNPRHSASNLSQATKGLLAAWEKVREHWQDSKAAEFYDQFLTDLPPQVSRTVSAAEELDNILRKVRQDCG